MTTDRPPGRSDIVEMHTDLSGWRGRSFTWQSVVFRAVWNVCWLVLASWTPPALHGWRRWLLNSFGANIGPGANVYGSVRVWYPPNLTMGRKAALGPHVVCYCQDEIILEDMAIVSQYSHLVTGTHDIDHPAFQLRTRPIRIGRYAWVASAAFVGPGVTVHEGAVLSARGVAFRDLDAWTVYSGNPAVATRSRRRFLDDGA